MISKDYREIFQQLWADVDEVTTYPNFRPMLAHYTSIENMENILKSDETWFSNPLNMNDYEELRYVVIQAHDKFYESKTIKNAFQDSQQLSLMQQYFEDFFDKFSNQHCLDIYAFCFSEYTEPGQDGLLSMWSGYGGNGKGAAIVLDTAKLDPKEDSPFIIAKVVYL